MTHSTRSTLCLFKASPIWKYHLPIDTNCVENLDKNTNRWDIVLNGKHQYTTAILKQDHQHFILINQKTINALQLQIGDPVEISLSPNHTEYGIDMPEELKAELDNNTTCLERFNALTPGHQRNIIRLVNQVKSYEARIKKVKAISHYLFEMENSTVDYKALNQLIKRYNKG